MNISDQIKETLMGQNAKSLAEQHGIRYDFLLKVRDGYILDPDSKYLPGIAALIKMPADDLRIMAEREKLDAHSVRKYGKPASEIIAGSTNTDINKLVDDEILDGTDDIPKDYEMSFYSLHQLPVKDQAFKTDNPKETLIPYAKELVCLQKLPEEGKPCLIVSGNSFRVAHYFDGIAEGATIYAVLAFKL